MNVHASADAFLRDHAGGSTSAPKLMAKGVAKNYGATTALRPTDLAVSAGELLTVLGPSGSGKTTLLQIVCGLVEPTAGELFIDGRNETHTPAHKRNIGVVFQNYALFPHLTVEENVSFPLQMRKLPTAELRQKVAAVLEMVGLAALGNRFPTQLSGGQQQRVALARCFVYEPDLILMDEPLGALDRKLRDAMQVEIKRLHRKTGATIIFVTHDQQEALALSDRICLMNEGRIDQLGTPQDIYECPGTLFAADFIGISNVLRGRTDSSGLLMTADGALPMPAEPVRPDQDGALIVRPEYMQIVEPERGYLCGRVVESVYAGFETRLIIALSSGAELTVSRRAGDAPIRIGDTVSVGWKSDKVRFVPATT